ncbi:MAG TPA: 50S ribosomal protein L5 [Thermoplasmatales archaeon]|nr:50S ribosomal protein L5 [Thermoplasmatales archaeon]
MKNTDNPMTKPRVAKVTVNIGVGEAGEKLEKAAKVLQSLTKHKPVQTLSKTTNKDLGIRKGMPIGCKVTLRKNDAEEFLKKALKVRENKIPYYSFDRTGNLSFGIPDHTLFPDQRYDPEIGIFGMDVCVTLEKPGYRVKHRRIRSKKIPSRHRVTLDEAMEFMKEKFNVEVIE